MGGGLLPNRRTTGKPSTKGTACSSAHPANHGICEIQVQTFHREGLSPILVTRIAIMPVVVTR